MFLQCYNLFIGDLPNKYEGENYYEEKVWYVTFSSWHDEKAKSIYAGYTENVFLCSKVECSNCHSKVPAMMEDSICPICKGIICVISQTIRRLW